MKSQNLIHILMAIVCFALSPQMRALSPPPDGGYSNGNTAEGDSALSGLTGGFYNSAVGFLSLLSNGSASFNTGVGAGTLLVNTAIENTAVGAGALLTNSDGVNNTACGAFALFTNTMGAVNNAVGANSLLSNVDGNSNNALGESALFSNIHASGNTAIGDVALAFNDSDGAGLGNGNTAVGVATLLNNVDGSDNTAVGAGTLATVVLGVRNVGMGSEALGLSGGPGGSTANVAIGFGAEAFDEGLFNTVVGYNSGQNLTAGFENIYIGDTIGAFSPAGINEVNTIRIGDLTGFNAITQTFVGGIATNAQVWNGVTVCQVTVDAFGHLGVDCVNPSNPGATPQGQGKSAPGAPAQRQAMLNDKFEKLQATVAQQQNQIETLIAQLREQAAQIQKVSAQLEASKPPPQMVNNP
jgi:hypothetical protein